MSKLQWKNKDAIEIIPILSKIYGKPSIICNKPHGLALWTSNDLKLSCFSEIMVRDEDILHLCPVKHYDYIYTSIIVAIKPNQVPILYGLSGSVNYDPLKNQLTARCGSIEANIATLKVCTDLLLNKVTINKVHKDDIYAKTIQSTIDEKIVEKLLSDLCKNVKKLSTKLNKGYWPGAFKRKSGKCTGVSA